MKKLFNADVLMQNKENKVTNEKLTKVVVNTPYYIEHSIYFAQTMSILTNSENKNSLLSLDSDYIYAELDSIATEQSNKDCYRAIIFLKEFDEVYLTYHSYGDVFSAEVFNGFVEEIDSINKNKKVLTEDTTKLKKDFLSHIKNSKPHEATDVVMPEKIALRTKEGTLKAADPKEDTDLTTLSFLNSKVEKVKTEIDLNVSKVKQELFSHTEQLSKKINAEKEAISINDFLNQDPQYVATEEEKKKAEQILEKLAGKTKPYYNVLRNKTGSITLPDATSEYDAVNKATVLNILNNHIKQLIDNAPEELDTLKELAEALKKDQIGIATINKALSNRYTKEAADRLYQQNFTNGKQYTDEQVEKLLKNLSNEIESVLQKYKIQQANIASQSNLGVVKTLAGEPKKEDMTLGHGNATSPEWIYKLLTGNASNEMNLEVANALVALLEKNNVKGKGTQLVKFVGAHITDGTCESVGEPYVIPPKALYETVKNNTSEKFTKALQQLVLAPLLKNGYVQFPEMKKPDEVFGTFDGYRWSEKTYNGQFLRLSGGNATSFGETQEEGLPALKGSIPYILTYTGSSPSGCMDISQTKWYMRIPANDDSNVWFNEISFDSTKKISDAPEIRPRNTAVRVWYLEKKEE